MIIDEAIELYEIKIAATQSHYNVCKEDYYLGQLGAYKDMMETLKEIRDESISRH